MQIAVSGATGHLGGLTLRSLAGRGVQADSVVALGRNVQRLRELERDGYLARQADYEDVPAMVTALAGADVLFLIASSKFGRRAAHHVNAIEAATRSGVRLIVYTSLLKADTHTSALANEHRETEAALAACSVPHVVLRNGWYMENVTDLVGRYRKQGVIVGASGNGRISAATRADLAEAAAEVLTTTGHEGRVYELGGSTAFSMPQLARELSVQTGQEIAWQNLSHADYVQFLRDRRYPEDAARLWADVERAIAGDELLTDSTDLALLLRRPPTTLGEALGDALERLAAQPSGS